MGAKAGGISDAHIIWDGYKASFDFRVKGNKIAGIIEVGHNHVVFDSQLPFFASFYKGKITEVVTRHSNELLQA